MMNRFSYKEIYLEDNQKILEVNILPNKCCNFDCIFCPIGRSSEKIDTQQTFSGMEEAITDLKHVLDQNDVDMVYINSMGEALVNNKLDEIIDAIKFYGKSIRLLSNGYLLGDSRYQSIVNRCDEVIGEIKVVNELDFQKVQRPIAGYTLENHINGMAAFNNQYTGKFILEITVINGYSVSDEAILRLKEFIRQIAPDRILIERIMDAVFAKKLGISDEKYAYIVEQLMS